MQKLCVIILNYRRAGLTIDCLESLAAEIAGRDDRSVLVVDNNSADGSAEVIEAAIRDHGWGAWAEVVRSPVNGGFAAGNNIGFRTVEAEAYLLLNNDTRMRPGSIDALLESLDRHPEAGMIGPRLEDPDGTPQVSCFRYRTPISEMLNAAGTGVLDRVFRRWVVATDVFDEPVEPPWLSFACVLVRREVVDQVGLMDEEYFMYFEDIDYSRKVRKAGWRIVHDPTARVIHLRGGSSSVKGALKSRKRVPRYYYESRSRYFAKFYGGSVGLFLTNVLWITGRGIAAARELMRTKKPHACASEALDNWTNWLRPMRAPSLPQGGEL
ncbi:MAG: glycosyltransferase family 2 protein [Phycisphaerales bacterium]|nr:MAG: glycosyltransferase family 2 protein [Phycisphaerales bacterium]